MECRKIIRRSLAVRFVREGAPENDAEKIRMRHNKRRFQDECQLADEHYKTCEYGDFLSENVGPMIISSVRNEVFFQYLC